MNSIFKPIHLKVNAYFLAGKHAIYFMGDLLNPIWYVIADEKATSKELVAMGQYVYLSSYSYMEVYAPWGRVEIKVYHE